MNSKNINTLPMYFENACRDRFEEVVFVFCYLTYTKFILMRKRGSLVTIDSP